MTAWINIPTRYLDIPAALPGRPYIISLYEHQEFF